MWSGCYLLLTFGGFCSDVVFTSFHLLPPSALNASGNVIQGAFGLGLELMVQGGVGIYIMRLDLLVSDKQSPNTFGRSIY